MRRVAVFVLAGACSPLFAAYQYYYSDALTSVNTVNWNQNGSVSAGAGGLSGTGGSLISKVAVPAPSASYEVKTTIALSGTSSNAMFVSFLRASTDAMATDVAQGTYYAVALSNPTYTGTNCSAILSMTRSIAGSYVVLQSTTVPCHNGMVIRSVVNGTAIVAWIDNRSYLSLYNTEIASGQPGVDVYNASAGNSISQVDFGPSDQTSPNPINTQLIGTSVFPNRVDFQWQGVLDDPNGTGTAYYQLYQNGNWIGWIDALHTVFSDVTVSPSTTYTYQIQAVDFHFNASTVAITVSTPPLGSADPRGVGIRPTGSYWGGSGENIDLRTGNLNFTLPLLKAMGRGGWGVGFSLSYNSQNWRQDGGGTWQLGRDIGYGYGWRLQAGSITPIYQGYANLHHLVFIDGTGAEYRLDQNNNGVFSSKESIYVWFDTSNNRLYFRDGSFWYFGATSAGTEQDSGTSYPTLMQDTNGNQVIIAYNTGLGATWGNSSARIQTIEDVRANQYSYPIVTYNFAFNADAIPHLTAITNTIGTGEKYTFTYLPNQSLTSPFNAQNAYGTWTFLQVITTTGVGTGDAFIYDGAGELTQVNLPYQGHLRWTYAPFTYVGSRTQMELQTRYLSPASGAAELAYAIMRGDPGDPNRSTHYWATVDDADGHAEKAWWFQTDAAQANFGGLLSFEWRPNHYPNLNGSRHEDYTWTTNATGNAYISTMVSTEDMYNPTQVQKKTVQVQDQYGNLTRMDLYDYGNLATPARTYTNTYLTDPNYTSRYIFNRLTLSTITNGTVSTTLVQNSYDAPICFTWSGLVSVTGMREHDDANYGTAFTYRGNPTTANTPTDSTCVNYDISGNARNIYRNGVVVAETASNTTNWAAPSAVTTAGQTTSLSWTTFLGLSSATGPNGDSTGIGYDTNARPSTTSSPFGAVTTYNYYDTASPPYKVATTNGHWVKTTLDGLGRPIKVEKGDAGGTKSIVDTVYGPCGCTPLGKMVQTSMPYAPGQTPVWTTYAYDGLGRTVTVTAPDGSVTSYAYSGNTVTVTDAAGKWKQFTMDAFGNLTSVFEPDPQLGNVTTTYTYDILNHLTSVNMPRGSTTQTRTFNYTNGSAVGAYLLTATNPENGTVSYTYNSFGKMATKTDAKGVQLVYTYDSYGRLSQVAAYNPNGNVPIRTYYYDSNPLDTSGQFTQFGAGRITAIQYAASPNNNTFQEWFSYSRAGGMAVKRLVMSKSVTYQAYQGAQSVQQTSSVTGNLDVSYTYDAFGRPSSIAYPTIATGTDYPLTLTPGPSYHYTVDSMDRPNALLDQNNAAIVNNVLYGVSDELRQMTLPFSGWTEARQYNSLFQLTRITNPAMDISYNYPASLNNAGKIASQTNNVSGEQITYQYDSLNRLTSAAGSGWNQSYTYDPFGNLTARTGTGTAPSASFSVNSSNNRLANYTYDANGNQISTGYGYDAENRIIQVNAGATQYFYDAQNKRIWQGNATWTQVDPNDPFSGYAWVFNSEAVIVFGIDGKMLGTYTPEVQWASAGMYPYTYNVPQNILFRAGTTRAYFAGRMIGTTAGNNYSGTGPLTAGLDDRLGSHGSYYPYGEERNSPQLPNDQVKFATYTRDSATGLDYADQRYYGSGFGRFMTADPYGDNWDPANPSSWNMYAYVNNDPVNENDPDGLKCSDIALEGWAGITAGTKVGAFLSGNSDLSIFAETVFTEARIGWDDTAAYEKAAISAVIMNRWQFVNGYYDLYTGRVGARGSGLVRTVPDWGKADGTLSSIVYAAGQFAVWSSPGHLDSDAQKRLNAALSSDETSDQCASLLQSIGTVAGFWSARNDHTLYTDANDIIFTSFGSGAGGANKSYYETTIGSFGSANVFYGVNQNQVWRHGVPIPRPPVPRPPRRPRDVAGLE